MGDWMDSRCEGQEQDAIRAEAREEGQRTAERHLGMIISEYEKWGKDVKERLLTFLTPILGERLAQNAVNELTRGRPTS